MMEGVSGEAASLAGPLTLSNLWWIYDNDKITIEGHTDGAFSEDVATRSVALTLVSDTNALLFTPMLAEVAGSSLEPTHISSPLRTNPRRTQVVRGRVSHLDLEKRRVVLGVDEGAAGHDAAGWSQARTGLRSPCPGPGLGV